MDMRFLILSSTRVALRPALPAAIRTLVGARCTFARDSEGRRVRRDCMTVECGWGASQVGIIETRGMI